MDEIHVAYTNDNLKDKADNLATQLDLSVDQTAVNQLQVTPEGLWLKIAPFRPMQVDFSWTTWRKRRQQGKGQDIIRACKIKANMTVIDATAGWGRDAALLASFGAKVIMLERNPIMQAMLADGLRRQNCEDQQNLSLRLIEAEAIQYLQHLFMPVDLIYIDPMHPLRQKSALVKKDLQLLQQIIGPDEDAKQLVKVALQCPCVRVVVKWPVKQPPMFTPTLSWSGKTVRYDCFINS